MMTTAFIAEVGPPSIGAFLELGVSPVTPVSVLALSCAVAYVAGALKLWSSGRSWSPWRTAAFLGGCLLMLAVSATGIQVYGRMLFSVFMFQQLTLMMAVPPLLALGAPGTLLLRSVPHTGLGRVILRLAIGGLRSPVGRGLLHPAFTVPLFLFTFYGFYLGDVDDLVLQSPIGHNAALLLFLASGIVFTIPLIAADPLPRRHGYLTRVLDLFLEMALHAFFGVIVMISARPLVDVFVSPTAALGMDALEDQKIAGALAWSYGEFPTVIMLLVLLSRWFKDDTRRALAADARADRYGNQELDDYNAYLERLNSRAIRQKGSKQ
jgi:putative membrane protein